MLIYGKQSEVQMSSKQLEQAFIDQARRYARTLEELDREIRRHGGGPRRTEHPERSRIGDES